MNKPVPSPVIPTTPGREQVAARHDQSHARSGSASLNVRYYRAMKPNRVYPLVVELPRAAAKTAAGASAPLVVKPVVAGAVVTPSEQAIELNPSGSEVTFHVAPVAKGTLKDARVEVSQQGRPVDTVPLKMKARTQRMTWILLLLTILLPGILAYYTYAHPLTGEVPGFARMEGKPVEKVRPSFGGGDPAPPRDPAPPKPPAEGTPATNAPLIIRSRSGNPGEVLQYKISDLLHKNLPGDKVDIDAFDTSIDLSSFNKTKDDYVVSDNPHDFLETIAYWSGNTYQFLCVGARDLYPAFLLALGLGALTLVSLIGHRTVRGKARKIGIRLPEGPSGSLGRTGGAREGMPATVEAAD
jgi:hypothetical protein